MKSLLEENKCRNRWYPKSVGTYKNNLNITNDNAENERIRCNFAYNMQYIEFLEKELSELHLSAVITTMIYKTYIITAMGIIESLFSYLLKEKRYWKTTCWEEIGELQTNSKFIDDEEFMIKNVLCKKGEVHTIRMDLDAMIKKVESKNLLNIEHNIFPALKKLRELRNRVHLHIGERCNDHDYNNFNWNEIVLARKILYTIITCPNFCKDINVYKFLKNKVERNEERERLINMVLHRN